jgi:chaperonin GroES
MTDALQKTKLKLSEIVKMPNVAAKLTKAELLYYGTEAVDGYNADLATRNDWASRNADAIKLALQVKEKKTFPWTGASNVKFPLVTIAALQFLARIGILTSSRMLAKVEPWGADPEGKKTQRADRIGTHMSYQLLEQQRNWLDDDEQAKFSASLLGCAIKKTYNDGVEGVNRSEYLPLMDFVVDYFCRDLDKARRATHRMDVFQNEIEENTRRGLYVAMSPETEPPVIPVGQSASPLKDATDTAAGLARQTNDNLRPYVLLEQHTWLDLDDDGYQEPYVMIVRQDTKQVLRIVARFFDEGDVYRVNDSAIRKLEAQAKEQTDVRMRSVYEKEAQKLEDSASNKIVRITATTHFTKYVFIPAPDGGFYGLGLGALLGPTNAAVDALINQIIDAGTMLTTSGGFLGRGVKIKSGKQSFDPFEWKPVDGAGDDLRKNIVPLPVNTPPDILFHLLGMLVQYGEKIGSATDVMTGVNPGQNTPAETSRNTLEQGMMLFSGIYKRMYRGFGEELRKLYNLNKWYIKQSPDFGELTEGESALFAPDDYDSNAYRVFPSADPTSVSAAQKQNKSKVTFEMMQARPNGFDQYEVVRRVLDAHEVDGIEAVYPNPKGPKAIAPIPNPKIELEKAKLQQVQKHHEDQMSLGVAELQAQMSLNEAKITELESKAVKELAEAKGVGDGHAIAMIEAQIGAAKAHREGLLRVLDLMQRNHEATQSHEANMKKAEGSNSDKQKPPGVDA